jgi:CubicO group peptidase (beta-lactamase class C family)
MTAPGVQYVVVDRNGIVAESASGLADVATQRPMDASTTLMAYSMSKTITAVAVLTLVEAGKVGLDDPIGCYLDAHPYGGAITVRQLLAHTSGIPNPIPLRFVHPVDRHVAFDEDAALAAVLRANPRPASEPGVRYAYSNIGYWLLGPIVARASGKEFTAYVEDHIVRPLGIAPVELAYTIHDAGRHAAGYVARWSLLNLAKGFLIDRALIGPSRGRWAEIRPHYANGPAFGGLVGTARAFGKFLADQLQPTSAIVGAAGRALFYETQRTALGQPVEMTLGWHVGQAAGVRFFYKEGGGGGFHGMMRLYPDKELGTVVLGNAAGFDARAYLNSNDPQFMV